MKRNREELTRIHKEKCRELKRVRAKIAEDLGVDLHQRECTYEGYCSGTCPKCMQEELALNAAIMKKKMEESILKQRIAAAGLTTAAAVCLSGCNTTGGYEIDGDMQYVPEMPIEIYGQETEGAIAVPEEPEETVAVPEASEETEAFEETKASEETVAVPEILEGDMLYIPTEEWELAGEIPYCEEKAEE